MLKKLCNNYIFNFAVILVISSAVCYTVFKGNGKEIIQMLHILSPASIGLLVCCGLVYQSIIGQVITVLSRTVKNDYRFIEGFVNAAVAGLFQGITPSATGGQFAQIYVFKKQGIDFSDSAGILWLDFIVYQTTFVLFTLVLLCLRFGYFLNGYGEYMGLVIIGFCVNCSVIVSLALMVLSPRFYKWISHQGIDLLVKIKIVKNKEESLKRLDDKLTQFECGINKLKSNRKLIVKLVLLNAARLYFYYSIPAICALILHFKIDAATYFNMIALASFVSLINAFNPLPGASGGMEAMYVVMFSLILGQSGAVGTMLLWRITSFYFILLLGMAAFISVKYKNCRNKGDRICV